jgi:hypothetical protein
MFLRPLPLVLVVFFAEVLLPLEDSASIASDPVPAASGPAARESAVIKRVLANWQTRQERIKSFHVAFDSPAHARAEFWMEGDSRYRVELASAPNRAGWLKAFDGAATRLYSGSDHSGNVWDGDRGIQLAGLSLFPILFFARPFSRGAISPSPAHWRVLSENAIIDNQHFVKLQETKTSFIKNFWVDPTRDDIIVGFEVLTHGERQPFLTIGYRHDRDYGWVPIRWTLTPNRAGANRAGANRSMEESIASFTINDAYPKEAFTPAFPPGTAVLDRKVLESYVVADDGSKLNVIKYDSPDALRLHEALDQTVDFQIDTQPLKDALEFIAQRYQIKVTFDAQAVRDKLIDPKMDVKLPVAGIKLRSCLNLLLEQSRKPLAYEIRKGALVIVPAARGK